MVNSEASASTIGSGVWRFDFEKSREVFHFTTQRVETTIEDNDDGRIVVAAVEVDPNTRTASTLGCKT